MDSLMKTCDARDGVADGMIFDPLGCDFDPGVLACKAGLSDDCIAPEKSHGNQEGVCGTEERVRNPGLSRLSI
jgi:hypothetical protein